jgi:hypothetical protein
MLLVFSVAAQTKGMTGTLDGNVIDEKEKALEGCTIILQKMGDSLVKFSAITDKQGEFHFSGIPLPATYTLLLSYVGKSALRMDSLNFRMEKNSFLLSDIILKNNSLVELNQVIIYAEKPLLESKEGNLTFNVTESANAAGATASELLAQVPLVSKDADGKITVRGKEPRILIDDKPVELNLQQLQDLLESMPGSTIEKIEVMTNPPPQYANEQGGVINIVLRKGKIGRSGRIGISAGTRGEYAVNGSYNYRKKSLAFSVNAGFTQNKFLGEGYTIRHNFYTDSSNYFNTLSTNHSTNGRPSLRLNLDYEQSKKSQFNFVVQLNQSEADQQNWSRFTTLNRYDSIWKLSERTTWSDNYSINPSFSGQYVYRPKLGVTWRWWMNLNSSQTSNDRVFYQTYLRTGTAASRFDSTQQQVNDNHLTGGGLRFAYDQLIARSKLSLSVGGYYNWSITHALTNAFFKKMPEQIMLPLSLLSNDFIFNQQIFNARLAIKKIVADECSVTAGLAAETTFIAFDIKNENKKTANNYLTWLPFANVNKAWKDKISLTLSYRRSVNRPGMGQLNPVIDFSDPYNLRYGNPTLFASTADYYNLVVSRNRKTYFLNVSGGYHVVKDIFSQVRKLVDYGKTEITWENISGRKEYEVSSWNGFTLFKKVKMNASASWTYMQYGSYDRLVRKFRNGFSLATTIGQNWTPNDRWNLTSNFTINRFANPQGYARWNSSLTLGVQRKLFSKRLTIAINAIDPLVNQQRRNFTYGTNFEVENYSITMTRNYRIAIAYNFSNQRIKPPVKGVTKKLKP